MPTNQSTKPIPSEWQTHVEQWRASCQTRSAYCAEHGVTVHALSYCVQRHRTRTQADSGLTLIPVRVTVQPASSPQPS